MSTTTDTPTTDRTVEYGTRTGDLTRWMDRDGDLPTGSGDYVWNAKHKSEAELLAALGRIAPEAKLVKRYRSVVVTEPEVVAPPLPATPGSVVRAKYDGRTVYAFRRDPGSPHSSEWSLDRMVGGILYVPGDSLDDAVTVFEPTA